MTDSRPILELRSVTKEFRLGSGLWRPKVHAVEDLDLTIREREIVALVGESGSGKSTVARLAALLLRPTRGEVRYRGQPVASLRSRRDTLRYRGHVQMVVQDPYSSMSPIYRATHGMLRGLALHRRDLNRTQREEEAKRLLALVGLKPEEFFDRFPHELSGGQRQRVGFAQAMAPRPELIVADEPVSMLDVSIRIGVLNVMLGLRDQHGVSFLYITHDIASAYYVADRVLVMYAGRIVETGPTDKVIGQPQHPYTQLLLSSVSERGDQPDAGYDGSVFTTEPPPTEGSANGCSFRWRCPIAVAHCAAVTPPLLAKRGDHSMACHMVATEAQLFEQSPHAEAGNQV